MTSFAGQDCAVISNACQGTRFFRLTLGRLPVLSVLGPAVSPAQFAALAAQLNLPATAYDTNGAVRVGVMGVYGAGGLSNRGDHFWGHGSVGPDIRSVVGYWVTLTPVD